MKKFVRGLYGRAIGMLLVALLMVPYAMLSQATQAHAAVGGRQNIILLPLDVVDDAPHNLAGRILQELQIMLAGQVGVQVDTLSPTSLILTRAKSQMDDDAQKKLMESYTTACDGTAKADARVAAAGALAEMLGVDAVVYGVIDQYEFTSRPDPNQSLIHITCTKVTKERNQPALASPMVVIGRSRALPDKGGAQTSHDEEAIANTARNLAAQLTGAVPPPMKGERPAKPVKVTSSAPAPTRNAADYELPEEDAPKPGMSPAMKVALAVGGGILVGALLSGGKGGTKVVTAPSVAALGWATSTSDGVEIQIERPDKAVSSYQILREDRGLAATSATRALASSRVPTTVVANIIPANAVLQNNYVYLTDGPLSTIKPTAGRLYAYKVITRYTDGTTKEYTIYNSGNPASQVDTVGPSVPPPVQSVTATPVSGSIVQIAWTLGTALPSFVTGFAIERKLASDPPSKWVGDGALVASSARSATRTVSEPGVYQYRVFAVGPNGYIHPLQVYRSVDVLIGKPLPVDSVNVTAVARANNRGAVSLNVQWPAPTDNFINGFEVWRSAVQRTKSITTSFAGQNSKLPASSSDRSSRGRGTAGGSLRPTGRQAAPVWVKVKTITTRTENFYLDTDVTDRYEYTYKVLTVAGTTTVYTSDPKVSNPYTVDLAPGEVSNPTLVASRGQVKFTWTQPTKNADGITDLQDPLRYEIYRTDSTSVAAGTTTISKTGLTTYFTKIAAPAWGTVNYTDTLAPLRKVLHYAIVPVDAAGQLSIGDYPLVEVTELPTVASVTIAPDTLTVTAGAPAEQVTVTAIGSDGLPVSGIDVTVDCTRGKLSLAADNSNGATTQTATTGANGRITLYWKTVSTEAGDGYITATLLSDGRAFGTPAQTHFTVTAAVAENVALTIQDDNLVVVDAIAPHTTLDPAKKSMTTATVKVTDSRGLDVINRKVVFACTDLNVAFLKAGPDNVLGTADDVSSNTANTDNKGEATIGIRAGFKTGDTTVMAFVGSLSKDATLHMVAGLPAAPIGISLQSASLPARDTSSTSGTLEVKDKNLNAVPDAVVLLTTSLGVVEPIIVNSGSDGKATFTLKGDYLPANLPAGTTEVDVAVTAAVPDQGVSSSTTVKFVGLYPNKMDLTSNVPSLVAASDSQAVISAKVYDTFGSLVKDNTEVTFTVDGGGVFLATSTRTAIMKTTGGVASAILVGTPVATAVDLVVTATSGVIPKQVVKTLTMKMEPRTDVVKVVVTPSTRNLEIPNTLTSTLTIQVTNKGLPADAGTVVELFASAGTLQKTATTDDKGIATAVYTGPTIPQVVTITAKALEVTGATQITVRGGTPALIELSCSGPWVLLRTNGRDPQSAPTTAHWKTTMYARVTDEYGNAVPNGTVVYFESVEPSTYTVDPDARDFNDKPFTAVGKDGTTGLPVPNSGRPYGSIKSSATTMDGACSVELLSSDRNTPAGGAEILARVNRGDGRFVFTNKFRNGGKPSQQNRIFMAGAPDKDLSSLEILDGTAPITGPMYVGQELTVKATLVDNLGQPCAINTPYVLTFAFVDDGLVAAPTITGGTDKVGELEKKIVITNLQRRSHRPLMATLTIQPQLIEPANEYMSNLVTLRADDPDHMTLTTKPLDPDNTNLYEYPQPIGPGSGGLGQDNIWVIAGDIEDRFNNPVVPTSFDATSFVTFSGLGDFNTDMGDPSNKAPIYTTFDDKGKFTAHAEGLYRNPSQATENLKATAVDCSAEVKQSTIGGAYPPMRFSFDKKVLQVNAEDGTNADNCTMTVNAVGPDGKPIPDASKVSVYLNSTMGGLDQKPSTIPLANSTISGKFILNKDISPGSGELTYTWKSGKNGIPNQPTGLKVIGPPNTITLTPAAPDMLAADTLSVTARVTDALGHPIVKNSMTVKFTVDTGFTCDPTEKKIEDDDGNVVVKIKATDPTKVSARTVTVRASCGGINTATIPAIKYLKPVKTLVVFVGPSLLPTNSDIDNDGVADAKATGVVQVTALDDTGNWVPDGTAITLKNDKSAIFTDAGGVDIGAPVTLFTTNGKVTAGIRAKIGTDCTAGAATVTASAGAVEQKEDKLLTFVGPPAKLTLALIPATNTTVVGSRASGTVTVLDAADKPVFDGYKLRLDASSPATVSTGGVYGNPPIDITTVGGSASFNMIGTASGTSSVKANYGGANSNAVDFTFVGTSQITMNANPFRFLSNGINFSTITVRGFLADGTTAVPNNTPVTLTTSKGYFNGDPTKLSVTGTFTGGIFTARLYGKSNPAANEVGAVDIQAESTGASYSGSAQMYGPVDSIKFDVPATTTIVKDRQLNLTARLYDVVPNPSDGQVTVHAIDANGTDIPSIVNSTGGQADIVVTPTVEGTYKVTATSNGKTDSLTFTVKASLPTTLLIAPVGVTEADAKVAADGSGNPIPYQITATDALGLPAGSITVKVTTGRGLLSLDQFDFSAAKQTLDVKLDNQGKGTIYVNGTTGTQPGAVDITATVDTLSNVSVIHLIGKPASITFVTSSAHLLANMLATAPATPDSVTLTAILRDSANQFVMDNTPVNLSVALAGGGAVPATDYRFNPSLPKTTKGTATITFQTKRLSIVGDAASGNGITISATAAGDAGNLPAKTVTVSAEGAQLLTVTAATNSPTRISVDGIIGPAGTNTNQTSIDVNGTAVDSQGNTLTGAQLYGLPITVTTTKGILGGRTSSIDTVFGTTGTATLTLAGAIGVTTGIGQVKATSGATVSDPLSIAFVGPADPNNFTFAHGLKDTTGDGIVDIYQDGVFTVEVTAKDNALPAQAVLRATPLSILATGLTASTNVDSQTPDDTGKVRWTLTATTAGLRTIYASSDSVTSATPLQVNVIPVAKDFKIVVKEEKRIFFDPTSAANLPKSTSFELTGYQMAGGAVQPNAEVSLTTDMGQFITGEGVTPSVDGKTAKVVLNQSGMALVRFRGDAASVGTPNITASSGTVGSLPKALNTGATPIQLIGNPERIIVQAYDKFDDTEYTVTSPTDDLRVMQDNPVTIIAEVQDKAGNSVLDGFMADFKLPAGSNGILRAATSLIKYDTTLKKSIVKADLASNYSGVYTVTGQALDTTGSPIAGVTDTTTVTIRTYAKNFTVTNVTPSRIAQDSTEAAKVTVKGTDANGTTVLAGTPARFTILQNNAVLAVLANPLNVSGETYGTTQDVLFNDAGEAEVYIRGYGTTGLVGTAGVQVSSYNNDTVLGTNVLPTFVGEFPDLVTIYGPGNVFANGKLTAVLSPTKVVPGSTATLTVALVDKTTGRPYYPDWYNLEVTVDNGTLTGPQKLATNDPGKGTCTLDYTLTAAEAEAKRLSADPIIHGTVKVTGTEQASPGLLQQSFNITIADKPWPGITDPAVTYTVDSTTPTTLQVDGLNITTEGTLVLAFKDKDNLALGEGRNIAVQVSDGGMARDANGTATTGSATAIIPTGTDGKISVIITAPAQMPASGNITITLRDVDANTVLTKVLPAGALTIPIKNAKPVINFTLTGDGPQRIYFSTKPEDQVVANLPQQTYIVLKGLTDASGTGSAGAQVTISTDRGQMRKYGSGAAFTQTITTTLDAQGELKIEFEGRGDDTELGAPTFTASDLGIDGTLTVKSPTIANAPAYLNQNWDGSGAIYLVGRPATIATTVGSSEAFQLLDTQVATTVLDKIGQPVLDNWPVEFIQTSTMWPDPLDASSVTDWRETQDVGTFRVAASPVTINGMCTSQFASNHSGLYSVGARVKNTMTPGMPPTYTYISAMRDITVKTFARTYVIVGDNPKRILCDGSQVSRLVITCKDADNKPLLEGITLGVHPNLGVLIQEDDASKKSIAVPQALAYPATFMDVTTDENAQLRLFSRGNNRVGQVGIEINNYADAHGLPQYLWNSVAAPQAGFKLFHFGPDPGDVTFTPQIQVTAPTTVISGANESNITMTQKYVDVSISLKDAFGNWYPYGYKVTLIENGVTTPLLSLASTDPRFSPVITTFSGQDDVNNTAGLPGRCLLRYATDVTAATANNLKVRISGEGPTGAVTADWPTTALSVDVVKPTGATFTIPNVAVAMALGESRDFISKVTSNRGATMLAGFPIQYEYASVNGGLPSFAAPTVNTAADGTISNNFRAGNSVGKGNIRLYYTNYSGTVTKPLGSLSQDIYIGIPTSVLSLVSAINGAAVTSVPANSTNSLIARLRADANQDVVSTYPIAVATTGGSISSSATQVAGAGQVNLTYVAPNPGTGAQNAYQIIFRDGAGLELAGRDRTSVSINVYGVPNPAINCSATAASKAVTLSWGAPAGNTPITDYVIQYAVNGGITVTTATTGTSLAITLNPGDFVNWRVAARNGAGTGSYMPSAAGWYTSPNALP